MSIQASKTYAALILCAMASLSEANVVLAIQGDALAPESLVVTSSNKNAIMEYTLARALLREHRANWSLDHFARARHALARSWSFCLDYGEALKASSSEAIVVDGRREPIIRSSLERMQMLRHAQALNEAAYAVAKSGAGRTAALRAQERVLDLIGLQVDAVDRHAAQPAGPPPIGNRAELLDAVLHVTCAP